MKYNKLSPYSLYQSFLFTVQNYIAIIKVMVTGNKKSISAVFEKRARTMRSPTALITDYGLLIAFFLVTGLIHYTIIRAAVYFIFPTQKPLVTHTISFVSMNAGLILVISSSLLITVSDSSKIKRFYLGDFIKKVIRALPIAAVAGAFTGIFIIHIIVNFCLFFYDWGWCFWNADYINKKEAQSTLDKL